MGRRRTDRARAEALDALLRRMFQSFEPRVMPDALKAVIEQLEEGALRPDGGRG